jgi:indoleamine 2,3-dioxygenase
MDEHVDNLENLSTLTTFTGSLDESWFYLISVAIEARGGPIIPLIIRAIAAARAKDAATVTRCLESFAERLDDLGELLQRMHENCDPHVFYHHIRPFLAGSKNMAEAGLPYGMIYEDGSGKEQYRQYSGGSNAQSSLIQFFDIVLGIEHRPTGEKRPTNDGEGHAPPSKHNFILEMRKYMPGPHRRFLEHMSLCANIRPFVEAHRDNIELCTAYDACLAMLRSFRDKHINVVTRYVVIKSRETPTWTREASLKHHQNIATSSLKTQIKTNLKGTGGTALLPFLKQARDETQEPAIAAWTRKVMNREMEPKGNEDFFAGKESQRFGMEQELEVNGLAGSWKADIEGGGGGLCHY